MSSPQSSQAMLTPAVIHKHMEEVIQTVNPKLKAEGWSLSRVISTNDDASSSSSRDDVVISWSQCNGDSSSLGNPVHYYGMALRKILGRKGGEQEAADGRLAESSTQHPILISFYLAYSTWDGRCLHLDQFPRDAKCPVKAVFLLQVLAQIAIQLGCRRLLWMQTGYPDWSFVNLFPDNATSTTTTTTTTAESSNDTAIKPETLDEWLMIKMDRSAMESCAGGSSSSSDGRHEPAATHTAPRASLDRPTIEEKIQQVCADLQTNPSSSLAWRLVLQNNMEKDASSIFQLVQGLAEYENEPDAVQCRAKDYQLDGSGPHPLFYCLLLDDTTTKTTRGMAFFYFGCNQSKEHATSDCTQNFLFLEDLYLEPAIRQKGGGTLGLKALAKIGIALDCRHLLWTALDWNQPALNLYSKMGARVQEGLRISRYKDDELLRFVNAKISI